MRAASLTTILTLTLRCMKIERFGIVFAFVLSISAVDGYTTHETTCTIPSNITSFVSAADSRGTLSILWSCLFTIFTCTWVILHLNIPEQRGRRDPGRLGDIKWMLKGLGTKFKWMMITILAPEVTLGMALGELYIARKYLERIRPLAIQDNVPWSLTHSYYLLMGGFAVRTGLKSIPVSINQSLSNEANSKKNALRVSQAVDEAMQVELVENMPISIQPTRETRPTELYEHDIILHLPIEELLKLREEKILPVLPYLTEDEIKDKSNSDIFTKIIAAGQVFWILVEVIARAARGLPISQLEIATSGFSACAVIIYFLNLKKPQGIQVPTTVLIYKLKTQAISDSSRYNFLDKKFTVRRQNTMPGDPPAYLITCGLTLGGVVFGGIHIFAWNFAFPNVVEQILWKIACVLASTALPIIITLTLLGREYDSRLINLPGTVLVVLYIIARLILLVEIFRTLCYLPPGAYINTWASNIPSIG